MKTPLRAALIQKDHGKIRQLISQGGDIDETDKEGRTLLMEAVQFSDETMVAFLISHGANVNACDRLGWTALHYAADSKYWPISKILIESGASVDTQDEDGNTPLWKSLMTSSPNHEMIKALLEKGADPYRKNVYGASPMSLAQKLGKAELIELLRRSSSTQPVSD